MPGRPHVQASDSPDSRDIGDLERAAIVRREATWQLSMSQRLARVHELSKQMTAIKGAASPLSELDLDRGLNECSLSHLKGD